MKIVRMKNTVFHLIPYCCAETTGTVGMFSGRNFLWLWWMFCFEPRYTCYHCRGSGVYVHDICGCIQTPCGWCDGNGWVRLTQGQQEAEALVKAHPLKVPLWTPGDSNTELTLAAQNAAKKGNES